MILEADSNVKEMPARECDVAAYLEYEYLSLRIRRCEMLLGTAILLLCFFAIFYFGDSFWPDGF